MMMKMEDNDKRNKEKLTFFLKENTKVHVERKDNTFWNGYILQNINDNVYTFQEDKFGKKFLFLSDIWEIEEYMLEAGK